MLDPRQMQKLMRQMGIKSEQIEAIKVIIETEDSNIVLNNPQVTKILAGNQTVFQISGDITYEDKMSEEDIKLVMEKANVDREKAISALKKSNNNIAEAIIELKEGSE